MVNHRKGLSPDEIANLLQKLSENESNGGQLSCSKLDSDEEIRLSESDSEESEESSDTIDNIPLNPGVLPSSGARFLLLFHWVSHARHHSKRRRQWVGVKGSTRNGRRNPKCPSARCLRMIREDRGDPSEGAPCSWMAADEAVGCTRLFSTMWMSSQRLVCRGRPEPGLRVNDISWIHWSQHLLTIQSERPN
ncbi:uncharacterized protein TNCV_4362451 [Trichonephila clavipes]|nr:uncharacterized protein TNCV_4362451 [Trichonephila clavipes]